MYCGLKEIHKIVGNKLQGGATELGSGTYGSIRTMASLPRPDKFFARTLDYIVQSQSSQEMKEFSKITFVRTSIKQLGVKDYLDLSRNTMIFLLLNILKEMTILKTNSQLLVIC
jgi:hypothetical protein